MNRLLAGLAVTVILAAGCLGDGEGIQVKARFEDVADLAPSAPVMMNDVAVGEVTDIRLDGLQALVTMSLDPAAEVPRGVVARVRRTSLLGERIVDLEIPANLPADAPMLRDGSLIAKTEVRPDLEDLVKEGTDVLAPIAASEVSTLVHEGATAFANNGGELGSLLQDLDTIVAGYAASTDDINALIDSLNAFNSTLAADAQAQGLSVKNTRRALDVLTAEVDDLETAIESLNRLSKGANSLFEAHFDEMDRFFDQVRVILDVLREEQVALAGILEWAPKHNRNTQMVEFQQFNQIMQDFIICGFNDDPSDPARTCEANTPNPGEP